MDSPFVFSWSEYITWYQRIKADQLDPAARTFDRILTSALDQQLPQFDRHRIRVATSRVKDPARLWAKMTKRKYHGQIVSLESIPEAIDDLVGFRVICNNLSDVTRLQDILAGLPSSDTSDAYSLAIEPNSTKDYFDAPKESGYRAYHVNLVTIVPGFDKHARVRGELQVRTLLQDGWGELTHEDTYKPGVRLPDLATTIARRMADLLATVDDLAQDLRNELDRIAERTIADEESGDVRLTENHSKANTSEASPPPPISNDSREALYDGVRTIVASLKHPALLTDVAQQVQSKFGTDLIRGWAGHGSFRDLLTAAVADVRIAGTPAKVVPPGTPRDEIVDLSTRTDFEIPMIIRKLRVKDRNTPAVGRRQISQVVTAVRDAVTATVWHELELASDGLTGIRDVNKLSQRARTAASERGEIVSRPHLDYVFKALLWNHCLKADLTVEEIRECLATHLISRANIVGIPVEPEDPRRVRQWLADEQ